MGAICSCCLGDSSDTKTKQDDTSPLITDYDLPQSEDPSNTTDRRSVASSGIYRSTTLVVPSGSPVRQSPSDWWNENERVTSDSSDTTTKYESKYDSCQENNYTGTSSKIDVGSTRVSDKRVTFSGSTPQSPPDGNGNEHITEAVKVPNLNLCRNMSEGTEVRSY